MNDELEQLLGDRYEVVRRLGEGGMGSVYLLRHLHLGELRVVKRMHRSLRGDKQQTDRFLREARLISSLDHPNLARLFDVQLDGDGGALLLMEFIPGLNLEQLQQRLGILPVGIALVLADQLLAALDHLHRNQVVHRDISPDNIMVRWDTTTAVPRVQLIDLGIAKNLQAAPTMSDAGTFVGKIRYSSPEQLNQGKIDPRSDLYSFGVLLYELLTGVSPIRGEVMQAVVTSHLLKPPRPFEDSDPDGRVPAPLRATIFSLLAKAPAERPASAEALRADLALLEAEHPPQPADLRHLAEILVNAGRPVIEPTSADAVPGQDEVTLIDESRTLTFQKGATPVRQPGATRSKVAQRARLGLALALILLIAALALWRFRGQGPAPDSEEPANPLATGDAAPSDLARVVLPESGTPDAARDFGRLLVDASPWAEVLMIRDERGLTQDLPAERSTPLAVELQPGTYAVVVRHGAFGAPVERQVTIEALKLHQETFILAEENVDALLRSLGW